MKETKHLMTLKEVAHSTGAAYRTIAGYAQKAGWTKDGKQTRLSEEQVTVIVEAMKQGTPNQHNLASRSQGIETSKSRILRLKILHQEMEDIYEAEIRDLKAQNGVMKPKAAYYDALVSTDGLTNFRDTAKELKISEKRFIAILLKKKYIYRNESKEIRPFADKMEFFEVKDFRADNGYVGSQTLITMKGKDHFTIILGKEKVDNDSNTTLFDNG